MISAIILSNDTIPLDSAHLSRIVDALHSARVLDIVVVHDGDSRELVPRLESLDVKVVHSATVNELSAIAAGITACDQKELHGVMIVALDQKKLSQGILVDLLHQFWISHKQIAETHMEGNQNIRIIADTLFQEIAQSPAGETLETFVARHADEVLNVQFDEQGKMMRREPLVTTQPSTDEDT